MLAPQFYFLILIFVILGHTAQSVSTCLSPFLFAEPFKGRMQAYDFHP